VPEKLSTFVLAPQGGGRMFGVGFCQGMYKVGNNFCGIKKYLYLCSPNGARPLAARKEKTPGVLISGTEDIREPKREAEADKFFKEMIM